MIKSRLCLFEAGYSIGITSLMPELSGIQDFILISEEPVKTDLNKLIQNDLSEIKRDFQFHFENAIKIAAVIDLKLIEIADRDIDYDSWFNHYLHEIELKFPMTQIHHYYFIYGYNLGKNKSLCVLMQVYSKMMNLLKKDLFLREEIKKLLKDIEYNLFKLRPSAVFVSGEQGHYYFMSLFSSLLEKFESVITKEKTSEEINIETLKVIHLIECSNSVEKGFEKCKQILIELHV